MKMRPVHGHMREAGHAGEFITFLLPVGSVSAAAARVR
jgi:hypothetical protein